QAWQGRRRLSVLYFPLSETSPASEKTVHPTFDIVCNRLLKMTTMHTEHAPNPYALELINYMHTGRV
ncbi:hypothetical protein, partial [Pseudomonas aeruginosa]|uniref:hypothetical protein n=1 Tax=Pseudomonas aeruginosa TaxID=287 RepID=UPI001BD3B0B1